jgi:biotin carboxyl carrier protein
MSSSSPSRRLYILVAAFAVALVALPFLFWYDTWFGRRLSDDQIERYLGEADRPRRAQQALAQIGERMSRGDASVTRWYPRVVALSRHESVEMRSTAAWIMGQDPRHAPFHRALAAMLSDAAPMVRRNAALQLAAFRDPAGAAELRAMLRPHTIAAPSAGTLKYRLKPGDYVNPGTLVARVGAREVRAELPGEVREFAARDGAEVAAGTPLVEIAPDETHAWEALRALHEVGTRQDLEDVARYLRGGPTGSDKLRQQAQLTLRRIESR